MSSCALCVCVWTLDRENGHRQTDRRSNNQRHIWRETKRIKRINFDAGKLKELLTHSYIMGKDCVHKLSYGKSLRSMPTNVRLSKDRPAPVCLCL